MASSPNSGGPNDSEYESVDEGDNDNSSHSNKLVQEKKSPEPPGINAPDTSNPTPDPPPSSSVDSSKPSPVEVNVIKSKDEVVTTVTETKKSDPLPVPGKSDAEVKREGSISPSKGKSSRKFEASWADENAEIAMPGALADLDIVPKVPSPVPEVAPIDPIEVVKVGQESEELDDVEVDGNDEEPPSYEEEDDYEEAASRSDRGSDIRSRSRSPYSDDERSRDRSIASHTASGTDVEEEEEGASDVEVEEKPLDDDEDKKNPQYIPKRGAFYEHDDRIGPEDEEDATPIVVVPDTIVDGEGDKENEVTNVVDEPEKILEIKSKVPTLSTTTTTTTTTSPGAKDSSPKDSSVTSSSSGVKKSSSRRKETMEHDKWGHDMFKEDEQKPKSKDELVTSYGYDIRNEDSAPKARRRRKYTRGPVKYTRNWQDQDAYSGHGDTSSRTGNKGGDSRRRSKDAAPSSSSAAADASKISDDNDIVVLQAAEETSSSAPTATSKDSRSPPPSSSGQQVKSSSGSKSKAIDKIALREAHREEERRKYQREMDEKDAMAKSYARRTNNSNKKLFEDRDREPQQPRTYRDGGNRDNNRRDNRGPRRDNQRDFRDNRGDRNRDDHFQRQPQRNRNRNSFHEDDFPELVPSTAPKGNITVTIKNNNSSTSNGIRTWGGETRTEPMKVIEALESRLEQQQQQVQQQNSNRREPIRSLTFSNSNYSRNRNKNESNDGSDQRRSGYREERTRSDGDRRQPPQNRRNDDRDRRGNSFNQRRGDGRGGGGDVRRDQDRGKRGDRVQNRRQPASHEHDDRFDDGDNRLDEVNSNMSRLSIENVNNNKSRNNPSSYREVTLETESRPKRYSALRQQQQPQHQSSRSMSPSDDVSLASTTSSSRQNLHHSEHSSQQHLLAAVQQQGQGHSRPSPPIISQHQAPQQQSQYYDHQVDTRSPPDHQQHGNFYETQPGQQQQQQQIPGQFTFPDASTGQFMPHPMAHPSQGRFLPEHHGPMSRTTFPGPSGIPPQTGPQSAGGPLPVIPGPGPSFLPSFPPSGYPQYPPPAPAPPSASYHQTLVAPAPVPPVQNTGPSTGPPGLPSGPELYRGGVTYYDTSQQQAVMRSLPPKRPKNIIPIVPPPDGRNNPGSDGHNVTAESGY